MDQNYIRLQREKIHYFVMKKLNSFWHFKIAIFEKLHFWLLRKVWLTNEKGLKEKDLWLVSKILHRKLKIDQHNDNKKKQGWTQVLLKIIILAEIQFKGNLYKCILKACFPNMSNSEFGPFNRNKIQKCFYGSSITH
jgi:hypothetical protein